MNQQHVTTGIVLARTDYGEADRIITLLTPDVGKLRLIAKGVRRVKSKLAGGIELFSVTNLTYVRGRGEIGTLVSARLVRHYGHIVQAIDRTMLGYDLIKQLHRATEDEPEPAYFHLLEQAFAALDDAAVRTDLIRVWFDAQLLRLSGHTPNLRTDTAGQALDPTAAYTFDFDAMALRPAAVGRADRPGSREPARGALLAGHIKFLRLLFGETPPATLQKISGLDGLIVLAAPLVRGASERSR